MLGRYKREPDSPGRHWQEAPGTDVVEAEFWGLLAKDRSGKGPVEQGGGQWRLPGEALLHFFP